MRNLLLCAAWTAVLVLATPALQAACPGCTSFSAGARMGTHDFNALTEASGLAVSTKNPGIVWSHNDDTENNNGILNIRLFAFRTNGQNVARYRIPNVAAADLEDMAVGPGPSPGVQYLYLGDIGGGVTGFDARNSVVVYRLPEPTVVAADSYVELNNAQKFTLNYPTAPFSSVPFWDAETMFVDPLTSDLYIGTKHSSGCWLYRVNLNTLTPGSTNQLEYVRYVPFSEASGGAMSADGTQIALRNEGAAQIWIRCPGETVSQALERPGTFIPVANEPNGEAIAFIASGRGYLTISDKTPGDNNPGKEPLYFFAATCAPTVITQHPQSLTNVPVGGSANFSVGATGENLQYQWRFNGTNLNGETSSTLALTDLDSSDAGQYSVFVAGNGGSALSSAASLSVKVFPPLIAVQPPVLTYAPTGSTVNLSVDVDGTPPFFYTWSFGRKLFAQNSPTLTLTNVQRSQTGRYRVAVTNSAGKVISKYASLSVQYPPRITREPASRTNRVGTTATFRVRASGSSRLRYQWYFNDVAISNATRSTLYLRRVQTNQIGEYRAVVTNYVGAVTSAPAILTVQ